MKWIILPGVWVLATLLAAAVLYRFWRGENVVLHGRWQPRVVRVVVVILVVLGVGAERAAPGPRVPLAPKEAGTGDNLAATGLSIDSLQAWDTMVRQGRVMQFKQAFVQRQLQSSLARHLAPAHIKDLIDRLDVDNFTERQRAFAELESILPLAVPELHKAAAAKPPLEKLQRIDKLLAQAASLPAPDQARRLSEVLPQTMRRLVLGDLESFDLGKPSPAPSSRTVLQALEELERVGMIDPWLHAYLWRKAGATLDRDCQAELFARLHRQARLVNALTRARFEAIRPIIVGPRAWMSKAGPSREIWLEEQKQFAHLVEATRKHYPTADTGTWQKDATLTVTAATPLTIRRGAGAELVKAGAEVRIQRLDLILTADKPATLQHAWLGRIDLPAQQVLTIWDLPGLLSSAAQQEVRRCVDAALGGDDKMATRLEQALPMTHAEIRQALAKMPTAPGAARLRLILALYDDTVTAGMPWKSGPAMHQGAVRELLE